MRLARIEVGQAPRLMAFGGAGAAERLLDLGQAAGALDLAVPASMEDLITAGEAGLEQVGRVMEAALRRAQPDWFTDPAKAMWMTPVQSRYCIAAGRNFRGHLEEAVKGSAGRGYDLHSNFPTGFVKLPQNLVPHRARVSRPPDVQEFDYEIELAAVIGAPITRASEAEASAAVFGYTIFNDLSAREWQFREMDNRLLMLGKNFPGFGPVGPCILTRDEVPDPAALMLELTVNGELRQRAPCSDMIFSVAELVAFWSRMSLGPGDLVGTGTPEGVARHRKPDPMPYYLKPGDMVRATISGIGTLETVII